MTQIYEKFDKISYGFFDEFIDVFDTNGPVYFLDQVIALDIETALQSGLGPCP